MHTGREVATPRCSILLVDTRQRAARPAGAVPGLQLLDQEPGALQRHADSFRDHGMRFAGGVADREDARPALKSNAGADGPGGKPRAITRRAGEGLASTAT